jgi:bile acid-coenzyme A ligase
MRSVAVIGLPDEDKGNTVHAIIEADAGSRSTRRSCGRSSPSDWWSTRSRARSSIVEEALRDDAGKVRRSALRQADHATGGHVNEQ